MIPPRFAPLSASLSASLNASLTGKPPLCEPRKKITFGEAGFPDGEPAIPRFLQPTTNTYDVQGSKGTKSIVPALWHPLLWRCSADNGKRFPSFPDGLPPALVGQLTDDAGEAA